MNITNKFTPGPWSINEWPQAGSDIAIGAAGAPRIAILPLRYVSINEQVANAKLIAAAPDLLAALKQIAANAGMYHAETIEGIARAAIAIASASKKLAV